MQHSSKCTLRYWQRKFLLFCYLGFGDFYCDSKGARAAYFETFECSSFTLAQTNTSSYYNKCVCSCFYTSVYRPLRRVLLLQVSALENLLPWFFLVPWTTQKVNKTCFSTCTWQRCCSIKSFKKLYYPFFVFQLCMWWRCVQRPCRKHQSWFLVGCCRSSVDHRPSINMPVCRLKRTARARASRSRSALWPTICSLMAGSSQGTKRYGALWQPRKVGFKIYLYVCFI